MNGHCSSHNCSLWAQPGRQAIGAPIEIAGANDTKTPVWDGPRDERTREGCAHQRPCPSGLRCDMRRMDPGTDGRPVPSAVREPPVSESRLHSIYAHVSLSWSASWPWRRKRCGERDGDLEAVSGSLPGSHDDCGERSSQSYAGG
jgi:hypothetical protein